MSYIVSHALMADYVNCTSLQAREAAFSQANCSDTEPSAPSSGNHTPKLSLWHDKTMDASRLSRFGMTCNLFEESRGAELLTWWLEASRARTSALPAKASESLANDPGCGPTWLGSLAKFDPVSRSWKTAQLSLLGDSELSSVIWPRSGMTAGGQCWELPMLERRTSGTGCGFLLPTPCATDSGSGRMNTSPGSSNQRPMLALMARKNLWPTPTAQMDKKARGDPLKNAMDTIRRGFSLGLPEKVAMVAHAAAVKQWPTPTVCGNHNRKGASATSGDGLATAVATSLTTNHSESTYAPTAMTFPTLPESQRNRDGLAGTLLRSGIQPGGQLNPRWVAWLMGWPIDHTSLKPSVTAKCQPVQPQLGDCLEGQ